MKKLLCVFAALAWLNSFSQQEWELIHDTDIDFGIEKVFMIDTAHIWGLLDQSGEIYLSSDGGYSWSLQYHHDNFSLWDLFFSDSLSGWAVGWSEVLNTKDGGKNWTLQSLPNPLGLDVQSVFFINQDTGWIAGSYRAIYVTHNGGDTWTCQNSYNLNDQIWLNDIHFFDENHGCAVGGEVLTDQPFIMTTNDGGDNWTEIHPESGDVLVKVQYVDTLTAWYLDEQDVLYKSADGGFTWVDVDALSGFNITDFTFFSTSDAIAINPYFGRSAVTKDGWDTWQEFELGGYNLVKTMSFGDQNHGIAVGRNGDKLRTNDGGMNWNRLNERFKSIEFFTPLNGWIIQVPMKRNFMHSIDGGFTWFEVETGQSGALQQMDFVSDQLGFAVTDQSELLKTTDGGSTWNISVLPLDSIFPTDIQFLDENTGFICTDPYNFYKTTNGGYNWQVYSFDTVDHIYGMDFLNAEEGWVVGSEGFVAHTTDGGLLWNISTLPSWRLIDVDFINKDYGFIVSNYREVYRTKNGGITWDMVELDLYSSCRIHFADTLKGWISGGNKIYYTADGGESWNEVLDIQTVIPECIINDFCALDTNNAWVCTEDGRIFSCSELLKINEDENSAGIKLYPNPVKDQLNLEFNHPVYQDLTVKIFSVNGEMLMKWIISRYEERKITVDLTNLSSGLYLLNLQGENISESMKFIKN